MNLEDSLQQDGGTDIDVGGTNREPDGQWVLTPVPAGYPSKPTMHHDSRSGTVRDHDGQGRSPSSSNINDRPTEGQDETKKDRDQVPDFQQPFAIRLKNSTAVAESPSETLSLTLRPKGDRA
ncbi:hypothetical protein N7465_005417 [Penicillium sp. CMV-2018d]|nr:hypothetical protein N7465_005417 [Penicillium sp. CMV-2018d]